MKKMDSRGKWFICDNMSRNTSISLCSMLNGYDKSKNRREEDGKIQNNQINAMLVIDK